MEGFVPGASLGVGREEEHRAGQGLQLPAHGVVETGGGTVRAREVIVAGLLAAHLIIFWLSQDSSVTPPVCLTAFAAAAIAGHLADVRDFI